MKGKPTDVRVVGAALFFLPVPMRMPLKFGAETTTSVICARVRMTVCDGNGQVAEGWGETPLSVHWVWPGALSYEERLDALQRFCGRLVHAWCSCRFSGHPLEVGYQFQENRLTGMLSLFNQERGGLDKAMPWLAALVCSSAFDIALHDAYGNLHRRSVYETYHAGFMNRDLSYFYRSDPVSKALFKNLYPDDFLVSQPPARLKAWHLVGGLDPLDGAEVGDGDPQDGYPVLLTDWIRRDGLQCLKIKLRGNDAAWDYERLLRVGQVALAENVVWLTADFNCTVLDPAYVTELLDRLRDEHPRLYGMLLYVEQPFPYDLGESRIDVHAVSARKPLFLDESAHDWRMVKLGWELGWTGVALKTCKTQTGAILSACWARKRGMTLMVQDLTNPMLAQIPHVQLAARVGTIMGVETNSMQFYPEASRPESAVHPGIYRRREGMLDLSSLGDHGFGYRLSDIRRALPEPVMEEMSPRER